MHKYVNGCGECNTVKVCFICVQFSHNGCCRLSPYRIFCRGGEVFLSRKIDIGRLGVWGLPPRNILTNHCPEIESGGLQEAIADYFQVPITCVQNHFLFF